MIVGLIALLGSGCTVIFGIAFSGIALSEAQRARSVWVEETIRTGTPDPRVADLIAAAGTDSNGQPITAAPPLMTLTSPDFDRFVSIHSLADADRIRGYTVVGRWDCSRWLLKRVLTVDEPRRTEYDPDTLYALYAIRRLDPFTEGMQASLSDAFWDDPHWFGGPRQHCSRLDALLLSDRK
ncbi:MAG: hypothetical protein D6761_07790 [Candidatus Dadabacteria bacterium]|nr:MAG: hypothetical protein D6761_07790 [Candidatus Dadabacteria bacterium]